MQSIKIFSKIIFFIVVFVSKSSFVFSVEEPQKEPQKNLKVLTFNTWLLGFDRLSPTLRLAGFGVLPLQILPSIGPINSIAIKDKKARMKALPTELANSGADIIALQEIWDSRDVEHLLSEMKNKGYPYSFNPNPNGWLDIDLGQGALGNGLLILSKFPISQTQILEFSVQTRIDERMTRKGAVYAQIKTPLWGAIDFYTVHAGALSADKEKNAYNEDHYQKHKIQITELNEFMAATQNSKIRILAGDLNVHSQQYIPGSEIFGEAFSDQTHESYTFIDILWSDSYKELHPTLENAGTVPAFVPHPGRLEGSNTEMKFPYFDDAFFPDERVDYIFYQSENQSMTPLESKIVFNEPIDFIKNNFVYLSDHFGVLTEFKLLR